MKNQQIKTRLRNIFSISPQLLDIIESPDTVEKKKDNVRTWLSEILAETYKDNSNIKALEYILAREAINVFRRMLSDRSEKLAGYSLIGYLVSLLTDSDKRVFERPTAGFFAEMEHLVKGIMGETGIYDDKAPAFSKHKGRKAARMRSADLSRMARASQKFMNTYTSGLENDAVRRRSRNKARIINFFGITDLEWEKWKWHLKNSIRDADILKKLVKLTDEEYEAVRRARELKIPFAITPYYLSLMDPEPNQGRDYAVRAQVIPTMHYVKKLKAFREGSETSMDFMLERDFVPTLTFVRNGLNSYSSWMTCSPVRPLSLTAIDVSIFALSENRPVNSSLGRAGGALPWGKVPPSWNIQTAPSAMLAIVSLPLCSKATGGPPLWAPVWNCHKTEPVLAS